MVVQLIICFSTVLNYIELNQTPDCIKLHVEWFTITRNHLAGCNVDCPDKDSQM